MSGLRVISAWTVCDLCLVSMELKVHPDHRGGSLPPESEWDRSIFVSCPICGESLRWEEIRYAEL